MTETVQDIAPQLAVVGFSSAAALGGAVVIQNLEWTLPLFVCGYLGFLVVFVALNDPTILV